MKNNSDVYIISSNAGYLECIACKLTWNYKIHWYGNFMATREEEMAEHLLDHEKAGHYVPSRGDEQ